MIAVALRPLALVLMSAPLLAQTTRDTSTCHARLNAPVADSESIEIDIDVTPFDTSFHISDGYQSVIGQGLRQFFVAPQPLELESFEDRTAHDDAEIGAVPHAALTYTGAFRAILHGDGTLRNVRIVGGTRDGGLDSALLHGLERLGASRMLPPPIAPDVMLDGDTLDLRILVTVGSVALRSAAFLPPAAGITPLLRIRVPLRRLDKEPAVVPGGPRPQYPAALEGTRLNGGVTLRLVVGSDGTPDLSSIQVLGASAPQFAQAVLDVLPGIKFVPMEVEHCPVRSITNMPFQFAVR
jgi:hypothetical protein